MTILIVNKKNGEVGTYIGRPSPLGNPFQIGPDGSRAVVIKKYREWLEDRINRGDPRVIDELHKLYKKSKKGDLRLQCWCSPKECHGDVIKEILEQL